jgi:DNA-binding NtrC family response regulator
MAPILQHSANCLLPHDAAGVENLCQIARISGDVVLLVEPDPDRQGKLTQILSRIGRRVVATASSAGAIAFLAEYLVNLVLIAENLPNTQGRYLAVSLKKSYPALPIVILGESISVCLNRDYYCKAILGRTRKPSYTDAIGSFWATVHPTAV